MHATRRSDGLAGAGCKHHQCESSGCLTPPLFLSYPPPPRSDSRKQQHDGVRIERNTGPLRCETRAGVAQSSEWGAQPVNVGLRLMVELHVPTYAPTSHPTLDAEIRGRHQYVSMLSHGTLILPLLAGGNAPRVQRESGVTVRHTICDPGNDTNTNGISTRTEHRLALEMTSADGQVH